MDKNYLRLSEKNWDIGVKRRLEEVIDKGANKSLPVVFDFDNTVLCRDIGEATFAVLSRDRILEKELLKKNFSPKGFADGANNLTKYYEHFLNSTKHQEMDTSPYANGYAWVVQAMAGMTPNQVIDATKAAYSEGNAINDLYNLNKQTTINVKDDGTSYRVPFFYPEMVELIGAFLKKGYRVYIVSASNVWSVRWMVTALNKKLAEKGYTKFIKLEDVIGVSTLLQDKKGVLHKDMPLALSDKKYVNLDRKILNKFSLTTQINYPLTGYYGKVANIMKWVGEKPYFVAGDSPNDHPMLKFSLHKLWIARLEKSDYQRKTLGIIRNTSSENWMIQPTLYKKSPGFVSNKKELSKRFEKNISVKVLKTWKMLSNAGLLEGI